MTFSRKKRGMVFRKTDGHCAYCGVTLDPFSCWHVDHAIPQARGGSNDPGNLFPSCASCNRSKGNRTVREFNDALRNWARDALGELYIATSGYGYSSMKMKWAPGFTLEMSGALSNLSLAIDNSDTVFFADDLFCEAGLRDDPRTFKLPVYLATIKEYDSD